jgi:hypothetical protein
LLTPEMIHYGHAKAVIVARLEVLNTLTPCPRNALSINRRSPCRCPGPSGSIHPQRSSDRTLATVISGPGCLKIIDTFR